MESPAPSKLSRQLAVACGQAALLCMQYSGMLLQPELCFTASFCFAHCSI